MNRDDHLHLLAERTALRRMIAETPAEDVIDLTSLQYRLATVEQRLAAAAARGSDGPLKSGNEDPP